MADRGERAATADGCTAQRATVVELMHRPLEGNEVRVRDFPWPYRGMLSISSDIDLMTPERFVLLHRFLNTREATPWGKGLGLDIADSFWFYASSPREMAFFAGMDWKQKSRSADAIFDYIRGGWIDTLHSFGNFNNHPTGQPGGFTREHAERALEALEEAGLTAKVWSNHGNRNNVQNVLREDHWVGDRLGDARRHSDLLRRFGVTFVWSGFMSTEFRRDAAVQPAELRDGQKMWQFSRQDSARFADMESAERLAGRFGAMVRPTASGAVAVAWHPRTLHVQLASENLAALRDQGGYAIIGQHLGVWGGCNALPEQAIEALRRLKEAEEAGDILVARTSRLLDYAATRDRLHFESAQDAAGNTVVDILGIDDPVRGTLPLDVDRIRGITFEIPGSGSVELRVRGEPVDKRELAAHRIGDQQTVGIRWFAPDYTDYAHDWERRLACST